MIQCSKADTLNLGIHTLFFGRIFLFFFFPRQLLDPLICASHCVLLNRNSVLKIHKHIMDFVLREVQRMQNSHVLFQHCTGPVVAFKQTWNTLAEQRENRITLPAMVSVYAHHRTQPPNKYSNRNGKVQHKNSAI